MFDSITEKLSRLTPQPGVYLMKDVKGEILYVGKAANLKKRVCSYFNRPAGKTGMKTAVLVAKIADFDIIVTQTEKEALLLESNLIKRHKPRYNVILKDGKRYLSMCLNLDHAYPNLTIVRKTDRKNKRYFGPYSSAIAARQTLKIVNKTFKLRKCKDSEFRNRTRPCLHHQMNACLGPCRLDVDPKAYGKIVKEVTMFLKGKTPALIRRIKKQMQAAARYQDFEAAADLRDKMFALNRTLEKQVAVTTDFMDRDVLGLSVEPERMLVTLMAVRGGFLVGTRHYDMTVAVATEAEALGAFLRQYYEKTPFIPKEILLPITLADADLLAEWLSELKAQKVWIRWPIRGDKHHLVKLAMKNAAQRFAEVLASEKSHQTRLIRLRKKLKLPTTPRRIECFDNSSLSGAHAVAGMVVFTKGLADKSAYRTYRIKSVKRQDDYAYMNEVLSRRFKKGKPENLVLPDLLMVDGGKGQLNIAVSVINKLGLWGKIPIIGLAKKDARRGETDDKVYLPGRMNPIAFGKDRDLLLFLQRIRDESHRFAVTFHRRMRGKSIKLSALDDIPGVGPKRKRLLLTHFGSVEKIRAATQDDLCALPGMSQKVVDNVISALAKDGR